MVMVYGERMSPTVGSTISFGQGLNMPTIQAPEPQSGRVVELTGTHSAAATIDWTIYVNGSPSTLVLSFSAETKKAATGNVTFNAGDTVWVQVTSGSASGARIAFFIIYD
jgi:hypothetical protein